MQPKYFKYRKAYMFSSHTAFLVSLLVLSNLAFGGLQALSPSMLAEIEAADIAHLTFQTGCAAPDLSNSEVDGAAVLEISFAQDAKPVDAKILSSNGSESDNARIIEALTKRCRYTSRPIELPPGVTKQFTYKWKAHENFSGLRTCRIFNVEYPIASNRLNEQGRSLVSYRYLPDGGYESKISQSSGYERLDNATLKLMNKCLDNHALQADADINKWLEVGMTWKLHGNESSWATSQSSTPANDHAN